MEINKPVSAVVAIIVSLILILLFVMPKYRAAGDLQAKLIEKQAEYSGKSAYYTRISELFSEIKKRRNSLEKIDSSLPSDSSFSQSVYFIQKKGSENGLIIKSISFSQLSAMVSGRGSANITDGKKEAGSVSFTVDLFGGYQGFRKFIYDLEKSSRLFQIKKISFAAMESPQGKEKQKNQSPSYNFKMEISVNTY